MSAEATAPKDDLTLSASWATVGSTAGILSILAYAGAVMPLLPTRVGLVLAFAFGPLLSFAFVGFYHFLKAHRNSPVLQAAMLCGVLAGTLVNLMLVVQQALFIGTPKADRIAIGPAWSALNKIQLGMDVSWDIYISVATILIGLAIWSHPRFGRAYSLVTITLGSTLLALNLATFPIPPAEAGSFDIGPLVALWFLVLSIRMRLLMKWWKRTYF